MDGDLVKAYVIFDFHGKVIALGNLGSQRKIPPTGNIGRIDNYSGVGVERAGSANADGANGPMALFSLGQQRIESLDDGVEASSGVTVAHHANTGDVTDFARVVDKTSGYFGPANIHADYIIILVAGYHYDSILGCH